MLNVFHGLQASPAACYICRLQDIPGKFLPERARELGVRPGPLFGQLKGGEAVMGSSRMVQPEEVRIDSHSRNGLARCLRYEGSASCSQRRCGMVCSI